MTTSKEHRTPWLTAHVARVAAALLIAAVMVAGSAAAAEATAKPKVPSKPMAVHLTWRSVVPAAPSDPMTLTVSDGYAWIAKSDLTSGFLLNERTGQVSDPTPPISGCFSPRVGGPWLAYLCGTKSAPTLELYSLTSGTWTQVSYMSLSAVNNCLPPNNVFCAGTVFITAGADWVEFNEDVSESLAGGPQQLFQNIRTGAIRATSPDPELQDSENPPPETLKGTSPTSILDLDSRTLFSHLCAPVKTPGGGAIVTDDDGELVSSPIQTFGTFAVVGNPYASSGAMLSLRRCGSKLDVKVPAVQAGNPKMLIFQGKPKGMILSTRRPFTFNPPAGTAPTGPLSFNTLNGISTATGYQLGSTHLFEQTSTGIWEATLPDSLRA